MRANINTFENLIKSQNDTFISEVSVFNSIFDIVQLAKRLMAELKYYEGESGSTEELEKKIHRDMDDAFQREIKSRLRDNPLGVDDYDTYIEVAGKVYNEALLNPIVNELMKRTFHDSEFDWLNDIIGAGMLGNPYDDVDQMKSSQIYYIAENIVNEIEPQIKTIADRFSKEYSQLYQKYDSGDDSAELLMDKKLEEVQKEVGDLVRKTFTEKGWLTEPVRESVFKQMQIGPFNEMLLELGIEDIRFFKDMYNDIF
jgi:hypothetical protein